MRLIDIAVNLTDPMYKGIYRGKQVHPNDLINVIQRAKAANVHQMIITGVDLEQSTEAIQLANQFKLYSTAGYHPTHSKSITESSIMKLLELVQNNDRIVAIGECGLDYDRFEFCDKQDQIKSFKLHFKLTKLLKLPMLLHCRNSFDDFIEILKENMDRFHGGVVHSFDGTLEQVELLVKMGLYIGINGCSLKTSENIKVVKEIPLDNLLLETDGPWCDIRPTHASFPFIVDEQKRFKKEKFVFGEMVKSRNEPCTMINVLQAVSFIKQMEQDKVAEIVYKNTVKLFRLE
jgi:TatD DNase family protein